MPAFKSFDVDHTIFVEITDEKFAAAFRALAYAWNQLNCENSVNLLAGVVRECRGDTAQILPRHH